MAKIMIKSLPKLLFFKKLWPQIQCFNCDNFPRGTMFGVREISWPKISGFAKEAIFELHTPLSA